MKRDTKSLTKALKEVREALFHSKGAFLAQHEAGKEISEHLKDGLLKVISLLEDEEVYLSEKIRKVSEN
jgi:hypothetical protein